MIFFNRTSTLTLDCFTPEPNVMQYTPIVETKKTFPEWWRDLPVKKPNFNYEFNEYPRGFLNMKNCYGFVEFMKKGAVLESWADFTLRTDKEELKYYFSNGIPPQQHFHEQMGKGFNNYHHLKLNSPWAFRENTGTQFLVMGSEWHMDDLDFKIMPGLVNFKINVEANVNCLFTKTNAEYIIRVGHPLLHFIPLSDKNLEIRNHLVSQDEFIAIRNFSRTSFFGWRGLQKLITRNEERNKKCPFGFGD